MTEQTVRINTMFILRVIIAIISYLSTMPTLLGSLLTEAWLNLHLLQVWPWQAERIQEFWDMIKRLTPTERMAAMAFIHYAAIDCEWKKFPFHF